MIFDNIGIQKYGYSVILVFSNIGFQYYWYSLEGGWWGDVQCRGRQFSADGHLARELPGEIRRKWENRGRENIVKEILIIFSPSHLLILQSLAILDFRNLCVFVCEQFAHL